MGYFQNAGFEQASINEDNLKEYKNEIIERLNKRLDCKRYIERLLKDKNNDVFDKSLTAIDVFWNLERSMKTSIR